MVTRAPASRHTLAAARSSGPPRLRSTPDWAQAARWSPRESAEEKDPEKVGRVCEVVGVRDGCEGSARKRAGLGGDECLAGWWDGVEQFCL